MRDVVAAVDLGTSTIKAALIDDRGHILASTSTALPPNDSAAMSFDAEAYLARAVTTLRECVQHGDGAPIAALCLSAQRSTAVLIGADSRACAPARSWQDTSCGAAADRFYQRLGADRFTALTGLLPSAIYTVAGLAQRIEARSLPTAARVAVLADYVLSRLGGDGLITDPSHASATGMMEIATGTWSLEILEALGVAVGQLPIIRPSGARVGVLSHEAARDTGLPAGTPLILGGGDQQCAVLGAGASRPGECLLSLGTSAALLCPTSTPPAADAGGLLFTSHVVSGQWVVEGFISSFGSAQRWASAALGSDGAGLQELAEHSGIAIGELLFVPFLAGIGSPDFDDRARAGWFGVTLSHSRADLARAVLHGLGFETRRVVAAFEQHTPVSRVLVLGGSSRSGPLTQMLADLTGRTLQVSATPDASLLGAAVLGWVGAGRFSDPRSGAAVITATDGVEVVPAADRTEVERGFDRYRTLVRAVRELDWHD